MSYRIVIPVVAQVEDFRNLLKQIPDKSLLTVVNNFDNSEVAKLCLEVEKQGGTVVRWPENRGCAASWNIGLHLMDDLDLDFVIMCSPSCVWDNNVEDFAKAIDEVEAGLPTDQGNHMYIARGQHVTDTHAFAITMRGLETLGYFDENFHPVYFEDADWYYRMGLEGVEKTFIEGLRSSTALNGGVKKDERIWHQYLHSAQRIRDYYVKKWGGMPGRERWTHPYNDETLETFDWKPVDRSKLIKVLSKKKFKELRDAGIV